MSKQENIRLIIEQEKALVLPAFDENIAFKLGSDLRGLGLQRQHAIGIEIRTGERPLFYAALPGSNADNPHWLRRKANSVHRYHKSTYRMVLEYDRPEDFYSARRGVDSMEYALAGGGFPLRVASAGMIGSICVSGLPERDDHGLVVEVLAAHLQLDGKPFALPPL